MTNDSHSNRTDANFSDDAPAKPRSGVIDAHGFDPGDFEWRPVPRRPRKDGWTPEIQQRFIEALARTGVVERACEEVGMSVRSAYDLRNARGGEGFARAWAAVLTRAADRLLDVAFEQAILGEEVPVYDQDGVRTGVKWKYNTRMAMFLLRAYHPARFGGTDVTPPKPAAVADVIASLAPVTPPDPHLLETPARLNAMLGDAEYQASKQPVADERYRFPPVPEQPPRVHERAARNRARRQRQLDRDDARREGD
jgi:hypothetical protein